MENFLMEHIFPIILLILVLLISISFIKTWRDDNIEKIDNLVNKNNLEVYENCWKLEGKYYCKKEND